MSRIKLWRLAVFVLLAGLGPNAQAQWGVVNSRVGELTWDGEGRSGFEFERSRSTEPVDTIFSLPCDPLMTARQEGELIRRLNQPCSYYWDDQTTLAKLARDVAMVVPLILDRQALEEIGLDSQMELGGGIPLDPITVSDGVDHESGSDRGGRGVIESPEMDRKWWRNHFEVVEKEKQPASFRPSLVVAITSRLSTHDLTIMVTGAAVKITTREQAEEEPTSRIYDVGAILDSGEKVRRRSDARAGEIWSRGYEFDALIDTIQTSVDPDVWECLGGNSSMIPTVVRGRQWLVVRTTTMTHWKVQRLLDRLNH